MSSQAAKRQERLRARTEALYRAQRLQSHRQIDRVFACLMVFQWLAGVAAAVLISPVTWAGVESKPHIHLNAAVILGGVITFVPVALALQRPGEPRTRHVIAVGQALTSALLIHLTGGRIETHFHIFGSLAFLAFYRDWKVLVTASLVAAADHYLRGLYWPQSVYGVLSSEQWRWAEHTGWVLFEDFFLIHACLRGRRETRAMCERQAGVEAAHAEVELRVEERTAELREATQTLEERNRDLAEARDAALEAAAVKSRFLATMCHEIRTPMNGVLGMNELLLKTALDEEQRRLADTVQSSATGLLAVINDILDFSKIEADRLELECIDLDLRTELENVAHLLAGSVANKDVELLIRIDPELPTVLRGDAGRIRQVLLNLLGNAIKFTESGEVVVEAACEGEPEGDTVDLKLSVRDTGIGIGPEALTELFAPFTQADTSTTRRFGGTGLGLAIVKRVVELCGGRIEVESELNRGSTFTCHLPLERGVEPALPRAHPLIDARILVVVGNASNRAILGELLKSFGCRVSAAIDARQALDALSRTGGAELYDALVIDDHLPPAPDDADTDPAATVRACAGEHGLPVVMLTGSTRALLPDELRSFGAHASLPKPPRALMLETLLAEAAGRLCRMPARRAQPQKEADRGAGRHILIAEDNRVNQMFAQRVLTKAGYRVTLADDGAEAVRLVKEQAFDLVLMDCQMPGMDGYEATESIRAAEAEGGPRLPIFAMTANALSGDRERCLAAGMDDYLTKPLGVEALLARIESQLGAAAEA